MSLPFYTLKYPPYDGSINGENRVLNSSTGFNTTHRDYGRVNVSGLNWVNDGVDRYHQWSDLSEITYTKPLNHLNYPPWNQFIQASTFKPSYKPHSNIGFWTFLINFFLFLTSFEHSALISNLSNLRLPTTCISAALTLLHLSWILIKSNERARKLDRLCVSGAHRL